MTNIHTATIVGKEKVDKKGGKNSELNLSFVFRVWKAWSLTSHAINLTVGWYVVYNFILLPLMTQ